MLQQVLLSVAGEKGLEKICLEVKGQKDLDKMVAFLLNKNKMYS